MSRMTQRQVDRLPGPPPGRAQAIHRISDTPGMMLVVGRRRRTFAFQFDVGGRSRRKTLRATNIADARVEAGGLKEQMANGNYVGPRQLRRMAREAMPDGPPTLRAAID